jgi:cell wall-associated protease
MLNKFFIFLGLLIIYSCSINKNNRIKQIDFINRPWQYKDLYTDTIPGTNIDNVKSILMSQKDKKIVVVAVLDSETDFYHKEITKYLWINTLEKPNNSIDDDHNGYIDDVHGWNFWGNADGQSSTYYTNFEYVRILKKFENSFENKTVEQIGNDSLMFFNQYLEAKNLFQKMYDLQKYYTSSY